MREHIRKLEHLAKEDALQNDILHLSEKMAFIKDLRDKLKLKLGQKQRDSCRQKQRDSSQSRLRQCRQRQRDSPKCRLRQCASCKLKWKRRQNPVDLH